MPFKEIDHYLKTIEEAFNRVSDAYIEKYEEEILTDERCNLRIRVRYLNGFLFELNEALVIQNRKLTHLSYRYHYQDKNNNLIFRYDNTRISRILITFRPINTAPARLLHVKNRKYQIY